MFPTILYGDRSKCRDVYNVLNVSPSWDYDVIKAVRAEFSDILLMGDANSAYTLADIDKLKSLDEFNLMMLEQPLGYDDIIDHAKLQAAINTPICLDEPIKSPDDARAWLKKEMETWRRDIADAGIKVDE